MDEVVRGFAKALKDEFAFMKASDESWEKAARGILTKMDVKVGSHRKLVTERIQYEIRVSIDPVTESALDP